MEESDNRNFFAKLLVFPANKGVRTNLEVTSDQSVPNYSALSPRSGYHRENPKRRDMSGPAPGSSQRVPHMENLTVNIPSSLLLSAGDFLALDEQRVPPTHIHSPGGGSEDSNSPKLDSYVEIVEAYKCYLCGYISESEESIQHHLKSFHLSSECLSGLSRGSEERAQDGKENTRTCFICGQCSSPFATILDVRNHIKMGDCRRGVGRPVKMRPEIIILERPVEPPPPSPPPTPPITHQPSPPAPRHLLTHPLHTSHSFSQDSREEELCYARWKDKMDDDSDAPLKSSESERTAKDENEGKNDRVGGRRAKKSTTCPDCGQVLSDTKALKKHIMCVHGRVRQYRCQVCAFSSTTRNSLTLHSRQHTGEKPFSCSFCHFKSSDKNTMRRHELRHTGEKPYRCRHCSFAAIQSSALKTHLLTLHPDSEDLFRCPHCRFITLSQLLFKRHGKVNHQGGRRTNSNKAQDTNFSAMFPSSKSKEGKAAVEDEESVSQCFSEASQIDTGGITIPAETTNLPLADEKSEGKLLGVIDGVPVPCEETMPLA